MKQFYYTYKITLLKGSLAGHYYYGQHKTKNINDGYAGSGKIIKDYFKHYDKIEGVTYVKEILHFYNDDKELSKAEEILIGDKFETDKLCLNLCKGGTGGNIGGWNKGIPMRDETKEKLRKINIGKHHSEEAKRKISEASKNMTNETRLKLSKNNGNKDGHATKGKHWKLDPETNKRIYY